MNSPKNKSVLTAVMITSGCTIGAGMFSLPVVSSGMWLAFSIFCLLIIWYMNYLSAIYVLEINVQFSPGASFDTLVKKILGNKWNLITGLAIAFLLYILLYAYFSAFGSIISNTLDWEIFKENKWSQSILSLVFGGFLAVIVWLSTSFVGRISTILVFSMIVTFIISMSGLALNVEAVKLFNIGASDSNYSQYVWAALPYYMTSFGFVSIVPSLYKHYEGKPQTIKKGLLYGSLIALVVYLLFIFVSFGNISRDAFIVINQAGGNMGVMVNALEQNGANKIVNIALHIFSNFAIISSFLAVGLGLFDYIADKFSFEDTRKGRFYSACITFLPPGIASFFFPNGFIQAIGFAGLVMVFAFVLVPFLMVHKTRRLKSTTIYKVSGGKLLLYAFLISSLLVVVFHIMAMMNYLPVW
jgi:tryptophan-specific transport protein